MLALRGGVLGAVRGFFLSRAYLEVETPVRIAFPALEEHIDAIPADGRYLRTSPELHIKRLLAEGHPRVFEMGPCFRKDERGRMHNPEFTMLEWYRTGADYEDILVEARDLVRHVAGTALGATRFAFRGCMVDVGGCWDVRTVREAFLEWAGWDPVADFDPDRFDVDLVAKVEPALAGPRPAAIKDFPAPLAALARLKPGDPSVAERWELYLGGMELANAFSELTDAAEQARRFRACAELRRAAGKEVYDVDAAFLKALESGVPACAGVALGIDRLVMLLSGAESIDQVRAF